MTPKEIIKHSIDLSQMIVTTYLGDLSDEELMVRPVPGSNHIAWQLCHLISSENRMLTDAGYSMPDLPDGLADAGGKEASTSDDSAKFHTKAQYIEWMDQQRQGTLAAIAAAADADLDKPSVESMRQIAPTIGSVFNMIGLHMMMHAGQFAALRRKLGKPVTI